VEEAVGAAVQILPQEVAERAQALMKEVFSSGGGSQSVCISALIVMGILPAPDFTVIADTRRERSKVWNYNDDVIVPALQKIGVKVHRLSTEDYGYAGSRLFNKSGTLLIPAFTNQQGAIGKLSNFCSTYWKIEVVDNFLSREHGLKRSEYRKWIGFSLDEGSRYSRMKLGKEGRAGLVRFPLIEDYPLRRHQAIKYVEKLGWPTPPRSACWMCPNHTDHEWRDQKNNEPKEFAKSVALEREIQERYPNAFLHKSCVPLDQVDFTEEDDLFNGSRCNSGACFV
jgi:hypothetical protein